MAIVVEDGSGSNPLANSYASVQDLRDYAALTGYSALPVDDLECEPLLINAMSVIEAECYKGERTYSFQPLTFPRTGLTNDGVDYPSDEIPAWLRDAQCSYAITGNETALYANTPAGSPTGTIIEETVVGAVSVKYSDGGSTVSPVTKDPRAESLLSPFYCFGVGGFGIGIRV